MLSRDAWLFLFAALGGAGGISTVVQLWLQVRGKKPVESAIAQPDSTKVSVSIGRLVWMTLLFVVSLGLSLAGLVSSLPGRDALRDELKSENLEMTVKNWLSPFGYGFLDKQNDQMYFAFQATNVPSHPVLIGREKSHGEYLNVGGIVTISPVHQAIISKLPMERIRQIDEDVTIGLSLLKLNYTESVSSGVIEFEKRLPITNTLTQDVFVGAVEDTTAAENLVIDTILKDIGQ
jgi:hypothetical protein